MSDKNDYRDTVFLPKTDFPMKAGLSQKEPAILARWAETRLYRQLREARAGRERFILHDGPPYANGDLHMGHAMNKILKDIVVRSQSLMGKDAPYIPGWDCHGLPIEWKVEEEYRKKKLDKDDVPKARFRAECRAYAEKWVAVQSEQFQRLGVMGEWDDPYLTMKYEAEAKIVEELLKFAESGQLYRGAKPVMWSPVEKTALAEAEVEYEEIVSTQIDVGFEIVESPIPELVGAHAVVWTTTPWTIPVNQAIAYGPEIEYVLAEAGGNRLLVAKDLATALISRLPGEGRGPADKKSLDSGLRRGTVIKGSDLAGTVARHPMHHLGGFFARPRLFLPADHVTTEAGTGLVHMAPDHGEEDFLVCKAAGIDPVFAVEDDGKYRADWLWLGGQGSVINNRFNAPDGPICSDLREAGGLLAASADFQPLLPAFVALQGQGDLPLHPAMVHPDGQAATPLSPEGRGSHAAPDGPPRDRRDPLGAGEVEEPDPGDGRGPPRLGDQPPARLGRADRALRRPQDRRLSEGPGGQLAHHPRLSRGRRRRLVPGRPPGPARQRLQARGLRAGQPTSSTSGSIRARPTLM